MNSLIKRLRRELHQDFTVGGLKILIVAWALLVILLALSTENAWLLAGIAAWEILP